MNSKKRRKMIGKRKIFRGIGKMRCTILITSIMILFLSGTQYARGSEFAWANQVSGFIDDTGDGIAMDYAGNVFITGTFWGTLSVGSETLECTGGDDTYIIKYDSKGNFLWARSSDNDYTNYGYAVSADASGNCILTGKFYDSVTFDGWTLSSSGDGDIYIVKFDPNGNVIWAKGAGGADNDCGITIATNDLGDTFISGYFEGVAHFDSITLTHSSSQGFLAKYDSDGNAVWAKKTGAFQVGVTLAYVTADESGNCYLARQIGGGMATDISISKYDTTGSIVWTKIINSEGRYTTDSPRGIAVDNWGNVFMAGVFGGILNFSSDILDCSGSSDWEDIFIAKYDPNGGELWARQVCGAHYGMPQALGIATDNQGDVIATGYFSGTVTFEDVTLTSNGRSDLFICKYDGNGNFIWALGNGGTSSDRGSSVAANECGNIAVSGIFRDVVTFGPTTLTCETTGYYVFVTKVDKTLTGDFDRNCRVDIQDLVDLSLAWLSRLGEPEWIPACDISEFEDGIINLLDFTVFAEQLGERY